ncbi:testis-expressed protein 47-like isoform X2 [Lepisosteus oculatus]|uniref:testis-expressed protein 47-like isoform X2 n=1 Tax=Lepisosteus oculatus TaxID=7918 RepID=UPI0035F5140B
MRPTRPHFLPRSRNRKAHTRLIYVAKISTSTVKKRDITDHYEQLFNHLQKNPQAEGITGLLLLYPRCILHVLESSSDVLNTILQDLRAMEEKGTDSLLKDARILVMSYSVPAHVFHEWGFRCLNLPLSLQEEARSPQTMESLVPDCLSLLYRLCAHLLKGSTDQGDREEGEAGEEVQEQDLLVEEETVAQLCHSTALRTPASFLQAYHAPLHVLMDSEIVWPTQCHLYW